MSKRNACERCRLQKLRCPPGENNGIACSRCERLGAACSLVGGSSQSSGTHDSALLRTSKTSNKPTTTTALAAQTTTDALSTNGTASETTSSVFQLHDPLHTPPASTLNFPDHGIDVFASVDMGDGCSDAPTFLSHEFGSFGNLTSPLLSPGRTITSSGTDRVDITRDLHQRNDSMPYDQLPKHPDHRSQLMGLNLKLTSRLQQCVELSDTELGMSLDQLLESALGDLSEFLTIIQSCSSQWAVQLPRVGPSRTRASDISLVILLNILSSYFQIVAVYDKLCCALCSKLSGYSEHSQPQLGGFGWVSPKSPQSNNLQAKLLVHAILRQFETIERVLGLPLEIRVTDKRDAYVGLFKDEQARSLLEAMTPNRPPEEETDSRQEIKDLLSLREASKRLQLFLGI